MLKIQTRKSAPGTCCDVSHNESKRGRRSGDPETPTVFVNGRRLAPSATLDAMRSVVQDELNKLKR